MHINKKKNRIISDDEKTYEIKRTNMLSDDEKISESRERKKWTFSIRRQYYIEKISRTKPKKLPEKDTAFSIKKIGKYVYLVLIISEQKNSMYSYMT